MYQFLNIFFFAFHTLLILFNLFGWIFKKTRLLNLISLLITLLSWIVAGAIYGWGYCPLTDWHWQIRRELGLHQMPASYIKFMADTFTGMNWNPFLIDSLTVTFLAMALLASVYFNIRDFRANRNS